MRELNHFGEKASDLDFGIHARLEAAEQFHEEALTVNDRGVALFRLDDVSVERWVVAPHSLAAGVSVEFRVAGCIGQRLAAVWKEAA